MNGAWDVSGAQPSTCLRCGRQGCERVAGRCSPEPPGSAAAQVQASTERLARVTEEQAIFLGVVGVVAVLSLLLAVVAR